MLIYIISHVINERGWEEDNYTVAGAQQLEIDHQGYVGLDAIHYE